MKVLVADKMEQVALDGLKALDCEVIFEPDLVGHALQDRLAETAATVLVVRSTKVDRSAIEASSLALIIRAGAGYNTIDIEAASDHSVYVANCPGKNSVAVAELAFGLMLSIDRRIPDNVADARAGKWNKAGYSKGRGLMGKTLGLVGLGKISQEMIPRAHAFGMNVVAFSRWMTPEVAAGLGIGRADSLKEIAESSDVVSVHVAVSPETKGMLDADFFAAMKPGAMFLNTSRDAVVDQSALEAACKEGKIFAGLDVFADEPAGKSGDFDASIKEVPNCYVTHHIGASTEQAQLAVAEEVVRIVREFKYVGNVPNVVNVTGDTAATHLLMVRHVDHVGVLAYVLGVLKDDEVNVQEMENIILSHNRSAIAQISLDSAPSDAAIERIKMSAEIFDAALTEIAKA